MIKKSKIVLVLIIVLVVLAFSLIIHLLESRSSLDIHNLDPKKVKSIKVYDRGLVGSDSLIFIDKENVLNIAETIVRSPRVKYSDISFRESNGLCEIELNIEENNSITITMSNTTKTGGILSSGDHCYRNDRLLMIILTKLRTKK
ncbi:hypothetical protein FA048_19500 [Pedobacter polaris]|uniref:Uncharacterized protein n=1 Tax=Pedobacter polaris TaxID=2571273 RepID=A0A4U1CCM3_9SPHI|nr:hypothetical protein [Pedobacter polaris]TKC04528.1 hypothetical protein FA048_19500 [Pedobacter polaris]